MKFDLNPDTFTLQNMFAMELHKFQDVIGDITASATKELGIEKGISEVADTWGAMKFTVSKFMKGTQERGFILGAVDEILQILDDNAMNLQSMSASRFVGPFLETVNKWEKSLSHIGEVVEVRVTAHFLGTSLLLVRTVTYLEFLQQAKVFRSYEVLARCTIYWKKFFHCLAKTSLL